MPSARAAARPVLPLAEGPDWPVSVAVTELSTVCVRLAATATFDADSITAVLPTSAVTVSTGTTWTKTAPARERSGPCPVAPGLFWVTVLAGSELATLFCEPVFE